MKRSKFAVIADIHYFSPSLGVSGRAYTLRSDSDQKFLAETGAIVDSAFDKLAKSDVDAVLIAGDLTNDGELVSHEEIRQKLRVLAQSKPVYLITSTHDWCSDGRARRYDGDQVYFDVPAASPESLYDMYREFGEDRAISVFTTSLGHTSVVYRIADGVRLLAVCDDRSGSGHAGYPPELLDWMLSQTAQAKEAGDYIFMMEHHLVMPCISPLINGGQCIGDREEMCKTLAQAGLRVVFVGHSHMQRVSSFVSPTGEKLTQVNVGSLCGYPCPINYFTVSPEGCSLDVEYLDCFEYENRTRGIAYIREHALNVLLDPLRAAVRSRDDFCDRLTALGMKDPHSLDKAYPLIKRGAKLILDSEVGRLMKFANALTFGKACSPSDIGPIARDPVIYYVSAVFLNVFDGTRTVFPEGSPAYKAVTSLASLPRRLSDTVPALRGKNSRTFDSIELIAQKLLLEPGEGREHADLGGVGNG